MSSAIQVNECSDRHVPLNRFPAIYLGPNPTRNGRFNIWINTDLYTKLGMKVFTSQGALVKTTEFNGIGYGSVIPVDLSNLPSGTYHLYLYNDEGTFISRGASIIIVRE
ncbi:MAG: T9SS type A sorting domain-containing protein [Chitinophagaceae bacterium]|nr:T9SS type A sorting domain-containing protein [Chitinophagaceae bacterium]